MDIKMVRQDPALGFCLETFLKYSSHAIQDKALPNVVDGLLPSQRRFLMSLRDLKAWHNSKTVKASMASSHTTGHYHPVGSVYQVMVNMSQEFKTQAMLTHPEGNWGEIENFQAAAERYTEIKMSWLAEEALFGDLPKTRVNSEDEPHGVVPCSVAYPGTHWEEDYLPARIPILLLNGSAGIAVGLAQAFQPMTFKTLLNEVKRYLSSGKVHYNKLTFGYPTGCEIITPQEESIEALKAGRGTIRTAANYEVVSSRGKTSAIIITSVPPYTTLNSIGDAFNSWRLSDKTCPFIQYKNKTEGSQVKLEFRFKRSDMPANDMELKNALYILYKKLPLVQTMSVNMVALKNMYPVAYNLEDYFKDWSDARSEIVKKVAEKKYGALQIQIHKLNLLLWVKENLDAVIKILRSAESVEVINRMLSTKHKITQETDTREFGMEETKQVLGINFRQVSKISEEELTSNLDVLNKRLKVQKKLMDSAEARIENIIEDMDYFLNQKKFKIPEVKCNFNTELAEIIDKAPKHYIDIVKTKKGGGIPGKSVFDNFLKESGVQDILVQTEQGFFFRVSTRSVRSSEYSLQIPFAEDKIEQATFINSFISMFINSRGKLFSINTDDIPYNTPIHFNKLMEMAKVRRTESVEWVQMIPSFSKKAKHVVFTFKGFTVKKIALDSLVSFKHAIPIKSKPVNAGLVGSAVNTNVVIAGQLTKIDLNLDVIKESSKYRHKHFPVCDNIGTFSSVCRNMSIGISQDKRSIFKLL